MNFFNGFGFGKHGDGKGCGCDGGNDIWTLLILIWILSSCGFNCDFDICELLPLLFLISIFSQCFCQQPCHKGPY